MRERETWTLEKAGQLAAELEAVVSQLGWLLSIYGSVLRRGAGNDLDIILAQKFAPADPAHVLNAICQRINARFTGPAVPSMFADLTAQLELPDGRLLDVQVRLAHVRDTRHKMEMWGASI